MSVGMSVSREHIYDFDKSGKVWNLSLSEKQCCSTSFSTVKHDTSIDTSSLIVISGEDVILGDVVEGSKPSSNFGSSFHGWMTEISTPVIDYNDHCKSRVNSGSLIFP